MKRWIYLFPVLLFMACSQSTWPDRSGHIVDSVTVSKALYWPASIRYIATGETTLVELQGLQRGFISTNILQCSLQFKDSTSDSATLQPYARIQLPVNPEAAMDATGLDTVLKLALARPAGSLLYLQSTDRVRTDTARIVSATVYAENLIYLPDTSGKMVKGRFTFQDSTTAHPHRMIRTDSLLPCETLQGAVFTRHSDTLQVRFHRLLLNAALHAGLEPCVGPHGDSVDVVNDRFGFPGS